MLFTIIVIIMVLAVAFVHYLQGFFSATLSAILAIISAALAFSWHEQIAEAYVINRGVLPNGAYAVVLVGLFAVFYIILRTVFDKAVPGALQLPAIADKIGGGVMGLVAAAFSVGIVVIAAQELGFGGSIGGFTRFKTIGQRSANVMQKGGIRREDSNVLDELQSNRLGGYDPADYQIIYPPVDDIVMGTIAHLSNDGALSGSQKLSSIHPAFLQELFGQRAGIQPGGTLVAMGRANQGAPVSIDELYSVEKIQTADYLPDYVRDKPFHKKLTGLLQPGITYGDGQHVPKDAALLVARVVFNRPASETDHLVRFSPGDVRLVGMHKDADTGAEKMEDYYPWGVVDKDILRVTKPDDYLFADQSDSEHCAVDLLFVVDKGGVVGGGNKIAEGVFIEVKRDFREDLSGRKVDAQAKPLPADTGYGVLLTPEVNPYGVVSVPTPAKPSKEKVADTVDKATAPVTTPKVQNNGRGSFTSAQANVGAIGGQIFNFQRISTSSLLPTAVALPEADLAKPTIEVPATGVEAIVKDRKFLSLNVKPVVDLAALGKGDFKTRELSIPDGQTMIQLTGLAGSQTWAWAQKAPGFELITTDNKRLKAHGAWVTIQDGGERLFVQWSQDYEITDPITVANQGQPKQIVLAFLVPAGVKAKELDLDGQLVKDLSQEPVSNGP